MMDCRTPAAIKFETRLWFNQNGLIMTKEQSVLTKLMKVFRSKKVLLQHSVLSYRIDLYGLDIDEKGHKDRNEHRKVENDILIKKYLERISWL